jgi:hypothetical protein
MMFANDSGAVMSPGEKIRSEVSIMQLCLGKAFKQIPIPGSSIIHWVETKESPSGLGPFIIMNYVQHVGSMGLLEMPQRERGQLSVLNLDPKPARLEDFDRGLANIVLSLSTLSFGGIGSLSKNDDDTWEVVHRPLSYFMNETVQLGTLPRSKLPTTTYEKALSYFESLAELHLLHLGCQRNEANIPADVDPYVVADDFRRKFVVRFLFRKVVRNQKQRKQWIFDDDGPFPVWCDDFRPENVLVDEAECIAGVIDWEFSYASPWWLLLQKPEDWRKGFDAESGLAWLGT